MGYILEYGCGVAVKRSAKKKKRRVLPLLLVSAGLVLAVGMFPEARVSVRNYLLPGDGAVTAQALQTLASDLQAGESFSDAITTFCQQILRESGQ